jgi:ABC-type lipoprotein export system ATPase subunit
MIKLQNISKYYQDNNKFITALKDINLSFSYNELILISGDSGSGKSTLLNIISGFDYASSGAFVVDEINTDYFGEEDWHLFRRNNVSYISQYFDLIEQTNVQRNIELGLLLNYNEKPTNEKIKSDIGNILNMVDLNGKNNSKIHELSGGEKQRVAIARAYAKNTPIILADEPTSNLDEENAQKVIKALAETAKNKLLIVVTHRPELFSEYATRLIVLENGTIKSDQKLNQIPNVTKDQTINKYEEVKKTRVILKNSLFNNLRRSISYVLTFTMISLLTLFFASIFLYFANANQNNITDNAIFGNFDEKRLIIINSDSSSFSEIEIDNLESNKLIDRVVKEDFLLDSIFYASIQGQYGNYNLYFNIDNINSSKIKDKELAWGRFPENSNEAVISFSTTSADIEAYGHLRIELFNKAHKDRLIEIVGGVYNDSVNANFLYFNLAGISSLNTDLLDEYADIQLTDTQSRSIFNSNITLLHDERIENDQIYITSNIATRLLSAETTESVELLMDDGYQKLSIEMSSINIISTEDYWFDHLISPDENVVIISDEKYQELITNVTYQLSIFFKDVNALDSFVNENDKYIFYYPYEIIEYQQNISEHSSSIQLFIISSGIILILSSISLIVLKKQNTYKKRDEIILLSIGYHQKDIKKANIIEMSIYMFLTYFITTITVLISIFITSISNRIIFMPLSNLNLFVIIILLFIETLYFVLFFVRDYIKISSSEIHKSLRGQL